MMYLLHTFVMTCALCMPSDTPPHMPFPEQMKSVVAYDEPPRLLNRDTVSAVYLRNYSAEMRARGINGTVMLWLGLNATGKPVQVTIKESSKDAGLDQAALTLGRAMRFSPARRKGAPIPTWVQIPIVFSPSVYDRTVRLRGRPR